MPGPPPNLAAEPPRPIERCRRCGDDFAASPYNLRWGIFLCKACTNAQTRKQYAARKAKGIKQSVWNEQTKAAQNAYRQNPEVRLKVRVRAQAKSAVASGKLVRQPCEVCGRPDTDAHHDDYSKPLEVRWLCRPHHSEHHRQLRATIRKDDR